MSHAAAVIRPQVLVVGAGSAGVAAAVAAAETGADTLLVEAGGHVGGTLARQLLEHSAGFHDASGNQVTGGVGQRVIALLQEYGGSPGHRAFGRRFGGPDAGGDRASQHRGGDGLRPAGR